MTNPHRTLEADNQIPSGSSRLSGAGVEQKEGSDSISVPARAIAAETINVFGGCSNTFKNSVGPDSAYGSSDNVSADWPLLTREEDVSATCTSNCDPALLPHHRSNYSLMGVVPRQDLFYFSALLLQIQLHGWNRWVTFDPCSCIIVAFNTQRSWSYN